MFLLRFGSRMVRKILLLIFYMNDFFLNMWGFSLRYQHTTYQRHMGTSVAIGSTPLTSGSVSNISECLTLCGTTSACSALLYDENTHNCSIYEYSDDMKNISNNQKYFIVQKKVKFSDALKQAESVCKANNSGFQFNPLIPTCYKIDTTPRSKQSASEFCEQFHGRLLRINNFKKQRFVEELRLNTTDVISKYRVDGQYIGGEWKFSDGQRIAEFYWYPGEPTEAITHTSIGLRCTYLGKWDDIKEEILHGCICEKDVLMQ